MKILLLGSGGREHALAVSLTRDPNTILLTAPGNPGTATLGDNIELDILQPDAVVDLARTSGVDLVVIGPEAPLVAGVADALRAADIPVFGPSKAAAALEGSKAFAKEVMAAANVPTAQATSCATLAEVSQALSEFGAPYVVKNDGLAAGKGVVVTDDIAVALAHAEECLGVPGGTVLVEEFLDGPEVSLFCLADGTMVYPLIPAQDYKRVGDDDAGLNTGGMGSYAPLPWLDNAVIDEIVTRVAEPTIAEMHRRGTPFIGLLYCGMAMTSQGMRVVEFNARFGDPETQAVLELLDSPLPELLLAAAQGRLQTVAPPRWRPGAAVTVVLAAKGYPEHAEVGDPITGVGDLGDQVRHAGTRLDADGTLRTAGGRVLAVVGRGDNLDHARSDAYDLMAKVTIPGGHYRRDIAAGRGADFWQPR